MKKKLVAIGVVISAVAFVSFIFFEHSNENSETNAKLQFKLQNESNSQPVLESGDGEGNVLELDNDREWYLKIYDDPSIPFNEVDKRIRIGLISDDPRIRLYSSSRYVYSLVWRQVDKEEFRSDTELRSIFIRLMGDDYSEIRKVAAEFLVITFPESDTEITSVLLSSMKEEIDDFTKHGLVVHLERRIDSELSDEIKAAFINELMSDDAVYKGNVKGAIRKICLILGNMDQSPNLVIPRIISLVRSKEYYADKYLMHALLAYGDALKAHEPEILSLIDDIEKSRYGHDREEVIRNIKIALSS